jgi:hypothetical protein
LHTAVCDIWQQGLGVAQQQVLQLPSATELLFEQSPLEPIGVASAPHRGAIGHGLASHGESDTDNALCSAADRSLINAATPQLPVIFMAI